jgi:hypothetical protein
MPESRRVRIRRWWNSLTTEQKQAHQEKKIAAKKASPKRKAKIAACKALLIEERKRLLGDRWRENCPFEVDE